MTSSMYLSLSLSGGVGATHEEGPKTMAAAARRIKVSDIKLKYKRTARPISHPISQAARQPAGKPPSQPDVQYSMDLNRNTQGNY